MHYIELLSKDEIPEQDFISLYEDFECVFTQYKNNNSFKIEVIFKDLDKLELFITFCKTKKESNFNLLCDLIDKPDIKTFDSEEADNWINFLAPVNIGKELRVVPPWHYIGEPNDIVINPSLAFGTGHHETTRSCLELLLSLESSLFLDESISSILDIGSGSGILSIFSSFVFKSKVLGIDNDQEAINQSFFNLKLNPNIVGVEFALKTLNEVDQKFDLIIVNISLEYLLSNFGNISELLNMGGAIIVSGFFFDDIKNINLLLKDRKFVIINIVHINDWTSMVIKRK